MSMNLDHYISEIVLPKKDSHKGENGRVLVIGGSELFHAAPFWAAEMASKMVDMVHFSSPTLQNNELMTQRAKENFWEGIVIPWEEIDHYIEEDDCILIGPGMERGDKTKKIIDDLLGKYPSKKWVVDGGALQEVNPKLLTNTMIVTPNKREQEILGENIPSGVTVLAKGLIDEVVGGGEKIEIPGGSPGMTKGGTGDALAGMVSGFYAKSPAVASCVVASYVNKKAGEQASEKVGVFFSTSDLIKASQVVLGSLFK